MSEKRPDPNATIQIDLSQIQLEDLELPRTVRSAPPPLPQAPDASSPTAAAPSAPRAPSSGRAVALGVVFVVLLVAAIAGGLAVGRRFAGPSPAESSAPSPP